MKYARGTMLKWTAKALSPKTEGSGQRTPEDRMIVLSHDECMFMRNGTILQLDMYKTHDSFVLAAKEPVPSGLHVHHTEVTRCNADILVKEFGLVVATRPLVLRKIGASKPSKVYTVEDKKGKEYKIDSAAFRTWLQEAGYGTPSWSALTRLKQLQMYAYNTGVLPIKSKLKDWSLDEED